MKIDDVIGDISKIISFQEQEIDKLQKRKERFQKIKEQYPDAQYEGGSICLSNIWNTITCMRIERKSRYFSTSQIIVKFLMGKKNSIDGMKIFTQPYENKIAEIKYSYSPIKKKEINIFDYKSIIPTDCPRRNNFIKRIKFHLLDAIMYEGLVITDTSFDKDEITKLMLLR
jgi:hypothetical protein